MVLTSYVIMFDTSKAEYGYSRTISFHLHNGSVFDLNPSRRLFDFFTPDDIFDKIVNFIFQFVGSATLPFNNGFYWDQVSITRIDDKDGDEYYSMYSHEDSGYQFKLNNKGIWVYKSMYDDSSFIQSDFDKLFVLLDKKQQHHMPNKVKHTTSPYTFYRSLHPNPSESGSGLWIIE